MKWSDLVCTVRGFAVLLELEVIDGDTKVGQHRVENVCEPVDSLPRFVGLFRADLLAVASGQQCR